MQGSAIAVYNEESMWESPLMIACSLRFVLFVLRMEPEHHSSKTLTEAPKDQKKIDRTPITWLKKIVEDLKPIINVKLGSKCWNEVDFLVHSGGFHFQELF